MQRSAVWGLVLPGLLAASALQATPILYVRAGAQGGHAGTQEQPMDSLAAALAKAGVDGEVRVAEGTYPQKDPLHVPQGVQVHGGYDRTFARVQGHSSITAANPSPMAQMPLLVVDASPTQRPAELSGIVVQLPDRRSFPGGSILGIVVSPGVHVRLSDVQVEGGMAGSGATGAQGAAAQGVCTAGGAGGETVRLSGSNGYINPRGRDTYGTPYCDSYAGKPGAPTTPPSGASAAEGGAPGQVSCMWNSDGQVSAGKNGAPGAPGQSGAGLPPVANGTWAWQDHLPQWQPPALRQGPKGGDGGGGSGGGGGGSKRQSWFFCHAETLLGTPGSKGGAGGCGGGGGMDGQMGGSIFGIVLGEKAVIDVDRVEIRLGQAGEGGTGGRGGTGFPGERMGPTPAMPSTDRCLANSFTPGRGGVGGLGGGGGFGAGGGGGNGGSVIALVRASNAQVVHKGAWQVMPTAKAGVGGKGGQSMEGQQTGASGGPGLVRAEQSVFMAD